jgi:lysyl-tRNA synthetase class 1
MLDKIKNDILKNKREIIEILSIIENKSVASEEIELCIKALGHSQKYSEKKIKVISSYLPMNLPLYSLITYVIIPRLNADTCNYRPSTKTLEISKKLHKLLKLDSYNINLFEGTRFDYNKNLVKNSDVVIFIGKPSNAEKLTKELSSNTLFIYFGVGQNPAIIANDANLELASEKIADSIMFNYGQDCAKPNVILCKSTMYPEFKKKLLTAIYNRLEQKTTIKKLEVFKDVINLLIRDKAYVEFGGNINIPNQTIDPIIVTKKFSDLKSNYDEYYAPVFRIMLYDNVNDLKKYFSNQKYKDENMNISLFGNSRYIEKLPASLVLNNEIVSDIDNGFCEYGGYGKNTSYLSYKGVTINKPLLINREINDFYNNESFVNSAQSLSKYNVKNDTKLKKIMLSEYEDRIRTLFGSNLNFSFIFGSYAKRLEKQTSDVDMFVCLDEEDKFAINEFRNWYFKFHYMYGKFPDVLYPGEVVTREKLESIIGNNYNVNFNVINDSDTFDSLFYTQIFTDKKINIIGDQKNLMEYEKKFQKFVPDFCEAIFETLKKNDKIRDDRDYMKCLIALSCNDLLFFGRKLDFEKAPQMYNDIIDELDDGFLGKCIKKRQLL